MGIFISVEKTIECVIIAVIFSVLLAGCCYRLLGILQSGGYNGKKFVKWTKKKSNLVFTRHILLTMLCALSAAVISLCFSFIGEWAAIVGLAGYAIFLPLYIWADNKVALKVPVTATPRYKRLYVILAFFTAVFVYLCVTLLNFASEVWGNAIFEYFRYVPLSLFGLLLIPLVLFANFVSKIYEIPHNKKFVKRAKQKLSSSHIKVIGITGSYGKTSTKHILYSILSKKFKVLATPRSHNTPLGIALSINNNELGDFDVFIAEMGARNVGDIAELCDLCPPDYSIITGVCPQHLESFGSLENIVKAKGEILLSTKQRAVIASDCIELFGNYPCDKIKCDCASEISCDSSGSAFKLKLGGESVTVKTKLLGRPAVNNIALAAEVAFELGMTVSEIAEAVAGLEFIEHRLQLIEANGVNILDDGYNSNIRGAAAAIEVLKYFKGSRIAVTPGLVELGVLEESENRALGEKLVGLDKVILVGDTLVQPVKEGYLAAGGDKDRIALVPTLEKAQDMLKTVIKAGDTVLFLNDLPDIY